MKTVRCGRLPGHDEHTWTRPASVLKFAATYYCAGHVVTTLAEQEWADRADFDEARDDDLREWLREGWAS